MRLAHQVALRHHNDVADESRAVSHHLPQTHPHPDYIATTFLPAIGMLRRCQVHTSFSVFSLTASEVVLLMSVDGFEQLIL